MKVYVCEVVPEQNVFSCEGTHVIWKRWRVESGDGGISERPVRSDWKSTGHRSSLAQMGSLRQRGLLRHHLGYCTRFWRSTI